MTRKYSHVVEESEYGRNQRSVPLGLSRAVRETARAYPIGNHHDALSLRREPEIQNEKQRRRIAVACSRCRKRKIKCSGDIGNGMGCQNCRNAGTDPQQCQFLRVNSSNFECSPAEWPYMLTGTSSVLSNGPNITLLNPNNNNGVQQLNSSSYPTASRLPRYPFAAPYPYSPMHNGQDYYGYGLVNSSENIFETPYVIPTSSQHYLSSQEAPSSNIYGNSDSLKHWHSTVQPGRNGPGAFDADLSPGRYTAASNPYSVTLSCVPRTEPGPLFPGMGSLANSLPASSHLENRLLPSPKACNLHSTSEALSGSFQMQNGDTIGSRSSKNVAPWGPERVTSGGSQVATRTATSSTPGSVMSSSSRKSSSASPKELHEPAFGYITVPGPQNSPPAHLNSSTEYPILTSGSSSSNIEDHIIYNHRLPHNGQEALQDQVTSSGSYAYTTRSGSEKHGPLSPGSESTLLSGQTYQPLNHLRQNTAHQQRSILSETLHRASGELTARNTPRATSTSLSKTHR